MRLGMFTAMWHLKCNRTASYLSVRNKERRRKESGGGGGEREERGGCCAPKQGEVCACGIP